MRGSDDDTQRFVSQVQRLWCHDGVLVKYVAYALGRVQWDCLKSLLNDGGQLSTRDIADDVGINPKRARRALVSLKKRNLVEEEVVRPKRNPPAKISLWTLRVARES